jgi:hypothetical protein
VIQAEWRFVGDPQALGTVDPQGCVFDRAGNLWGNDVGGGAIGVATGGIVVFFADSGVDSSGRARKAYSRYCFVARGLGSPGMPVADAAGAIYVPQATGDHGPLQPLSDFTERPEFSADAGRVTKFTTSAPLTVDDCGADHELTAAGRKKITRDDEFITFPTSGVVTPESITTVPSGFDLATPTSAPGHFYVGSVLLPPAINEYDANGRFVRNIVAPFLPRNPLGMDASPRDGSLYYAELSLTPRMQRDEDGAPSGLDPFSTGCGRLSMVRFQNGVPLPPTVLRENLLFPDGVTVVDSSRFDVDFAALPDVPEQSPEACAPE